MIFFTIICPLSWTIAYVLNPSCEYDIKANKYKPKFNEITWLIGVFIFLLIGMALDYLLF